MNKNRCLQMAIVMGIFLLFPACQIQGEIDPTVPPPQSTASVIPTKTPPAIETETVLDDQPTETAVQPPPTDPPPTATAVETPPTATPEPQIMSDFVRRLCPDLKMPLGLYSLAEPFIDQNSDPETVYTLYQVAELLPDDAKSPCTLYLSPGPMGAPLLTGNDLFWSSFDYDAESVIIWQYDPLSDPANEVLPQHIPLVQTTIYTSLGKAGLVDFVASADGELLVWSYTDPRVNEDNQFAYVQAIYATSPDDSPDQRPPVELWYDVVPETDGRSHIIRLQRISADKDRLYYSDEPIGLGTHWPEPAGQYSSLYSISTWGNAEPELHADCGQDHWCISDFSAGVDLLARILPNMDEIEVQSLSSGEVISKMQVPEGYNIVRQALISPEGGIAFMAVALSGSIFDAPPTDVALFYSEPPYSADPVLIWSDAGVQNLRGWVSSSKLLVDGNRLDGTPPEGFMPPSGLMLVDIASRSGTWLPEDERLLSTLVP